MEHPSASRPERRILLTLEYEGTSYCGWQVQPEVPTVEGALRRAIERALGHPAETQGASRTDTGVHALGQAVAFTTESRVPTENVPRVLNAALPDDIRVRAAREVPAGFHPRSESKGKLYRYSWILLSEATVFARRFTSPLKRWPDAKAMRRAATGILGEHDFQSFQCAVDEPPASTRRRILSVTIAEHRPVLHIHVLGTAFLYRMVRTIAGSLLEVGLGRRDPGWIEHVLAAKDRRAAGPTAEARGLCLLRVYFDAESLGQEGRDVEAGRHPITRDTPAGWFDFGEPL